VNDEEFVQVFMQGALPATQFHHRDHLRLTWLLVRRLGPGPAGGEVAAGIRRFAAHHGQADKYHETVTRFWVRIVGHMAGARPDIADFEEFLSAFPQLLDKGLPYRHWRRETMSSALARALWVEPDLLALPD
jgi:hypothetical protein